MNGVYVGVTSRSQTGVAVLCVCVCACVGVCGCDVAWVFGYGGCVLVVRMAHGSGKGWLDYCMDCAQSLVLVIWVLFGAVVTVCVYIVTGKVLHSARYKGISWDRFYPTLTDEKRRREGEA